MATSKGHSMTSRLLIVLVVLAILVAGCGPERGTSERESEKENASGKGTAAGEKTVEKKYTPPKRLLSAPEPAVSPPLEEKPAGEVIDLGPGQKVSSLTPRRDSSRWACAIQTSSRW
jgi:hypothetical protein